MYDVIRLRPHVRNNLNYISMQFEGDSIIFIGNSANSGVAISLREGSVIKLYEEESQVFFKENSAEYYRGAMYVEEAGFWVSSTAFFIEFNYENLNIELNIIQQEKLE